MTHDTTITCCLCGTKCVTDQSPWAVKLPEGWKAEAGAFDWYYSCANCSGTAKRAWRVRGRQLAGVVVMAAAAAIAVVASKVLAAWW